VRRNLLGSMVLLFLLAFTIILGGIRTVPAVTDNSVYVNPENTSTTKGSDFTVDIDVANITLDDPNCTYGVFGWEFRMIFNASLIEVVNVEEGPYLKLPYEDTAFIVMEPEPGYLIVNNFLIGYPDQGVDGDGTLANVTFNTLAEGTGSLHFNTTVIRSFDWDIYNLTRIDHTAKDGSVTVNPGHDIAVVDITAPPKASVDSNVPINVTIKNEGSFPESGNVKLYHGTTEIGTQSFTSLASDDSADFSFTWSTTGLTPGNYTLNATATISVDNDPTDNSRTETIKLVKHDIAVTNIDSPKKVTIETTATINVTVENLAVSTEAFNLTIHYFNETFTDLIGFDDTVQLPAGESTIVSFSWNTSGLWPGEYAINATATVLPTGQNPSGIDDDPTDNSMTKPITLRIVHDIAPISISAEAVAVDSNVPVYVKVENYGSSAENANVSLYFMNVTSGNFTFIDSKNETLALLTSITVTLTWNTMDLDADVYTLMADATILPSSQNPYGENDDINDDVFYKSVYVPPIECDVNGDSTVNISDLSDFAEAYGSEHRLPPETPDPNWDIHCDSNWDSKVDVSDLFNLGKNFGKTS
jgi:hypothetical protein